MAHDEPQFLSRITTSPIQGCLVEIMDLSDSEDIPLGGDQWDPSQVDLGAILSNASVSYFFHDRSNNVLHMNACAMDLFGLESLDEKVNLTSLICDKSVDLLDYHLRQLTETKRRSSVEIVLRTPGDTHVTVLAETSLFRPGTFQTVMVDVTARKKHLRERAQFEERVRQSQKLEILYQLSGGIAHDFNNLLQVLELQSTLAESLFDDDNHEGKQAVSQISESVKRGSELTKRLMAFSRKAPLSKERIDLNEIVRNSMSIIKPAYGTTGDVSIETSDEPLGVWVDPVQIEQIMVNLCLNALDATKAGGNLTIQTSSVTQTQPSRKSGLDLFVGRYAKILVSDNGSGIPSSIRDSIFEPFTTTKEVGKGTGLGLAIVHSILQQQEGAIDVVESSEAGTTFALYLPLFRLAAPAVSLVTQAKAADSCFEGLKVNQFTVALVAEDEIAIRQALIQMLESSGVTVLPAANGAEAIEIIDNHSDIELVISDVVMPSKGGLEVCEHYRSTDSTGTIVLISGHGDSVLDQDYLFKHNAHFLQKPFSLARLERELASRARVTAGRS